MTGFITSANYSIKKLTHILFINNRLVNSTSLRKAIEVVYSSYLPKNTHPFVYMSIEIAACNIDVNVHPTKHEVLFLHEDLITAAIQKTVEDCLLGCNSSRTYYTQALLPGATIPVSLDEFTTSKTDTGKMYDHQMVRTDSREIKLDAFIIPQPGKESNGGRDEDGIVEMGGACKRNLPHPSPAQHRKKSHCPVRLDSVKNLISELNKKQHKDLSVLFNDHKFVGCVDQTRALVQYQTKLYLVNVTNITKQLFYQLLLMDFANFNIIRLNPPPLLYDLAIIGLESPQSGWSEAEDGSKELLAKNVVSFLKTKSAMLKDYWSFEIDEDGRLLSIPLLLEGYTPNVDRLPLLILRLSTEVNWEEEERCFNTLANEYAMFYSVQYDPYLLDNANKEMSNTNPSSNSNSESGLMKRFPWRWIIEHVVFSAMRSEFVPQKEMAEDGTVLQIADLKDLYKVFERC